MEQLNYRADNTATARDAAKARIDAHVAQRTASPDMGGSQESPRDPSDVLPVLGSFTLSADETLRPGVADVHIIETAVRASIKNSDPTVAYNAVTRTVSFVITPKN